MRVQIKVPMDHVTVVLTGVTAEDAKALIKVLDADRNHPARAELYAVMQRVKAMLDPEINWGVTLRDMAKLE